MALELCMLPLAKWPFRSAYKTWQAIRHVRSVREKLRSFHTPGISLARFQYAETAKQMGEDTAAIERMISEWLY
jgi:hypothetical protein